MVFSERLEHSKYDFQHLQGTVRAQKPAQFRCFSEGQSACSFICQMQLFENADDEMHDDNVEIYNIIICTNYNF